GATLHVVGGLACGAVACAGWDEAWAAWAAAGGSHAYRHLPGCYVCAAPWSSPLCPMRDLVCRAPWGGSLWVCQTPLDHVVWEGRYGWCPMACPWGQPLG